VVERGAPSPSFGVPHVTSFLTGGPTVRQYYVEKIARKEFRTLTHHTSYRWVLIPSMPIFNPN
jgi:hypothetical protein